LRILVTVDPGLPVPPKLYGGIERVVDGLIHGLRERGHVIGLVAHPDSQCPVDYLRPWPTASNGSTKHIRSAITLMRAVRAFGPHLVHSFSRLGYLLPILPQRLPKLMSYQRHTSGNQISVAGKLAGKSLAFTGCSEFIARLGRPWGSEWTAIPNFVDTDFYTFSPTVAEDAPLVFLSRIERIKGAHTAIAIAQKTGRRLILAGNRVTHEEGETYWKKEIEPFLNTDGIEYIGPVNDQQKNDLLGSAAAMIVPIEWDEPFGIVFAEALACGTPVISCARGALPEIIRHGVDGFLIRDIAEGCEAVRTIGSIKRVECRERAVAQFSSQTVVSQYLDLYNQRIEALQVA
jgi:glycosyltransferase involved in cell wall biosynthesis